MKKLLTLLAACGAMIYFSSCSDDDGDPDNGITISGIPVTASIDNLGTLSPVTATISGDDGIASLTITKDGAAFADTTFTGSPTTATVDFTYTAVADDADKNIAFVFTATDSDGDTAVVNHVLAVGAAPEPIPNEVKSGLISANETWTADRIYELSGRVVVDDGVTLTIEAGTIIKGREGEGSLASALVVARGGMLMANGTADNPIVFTSILDDIAVGQKFGSNLNETNSGLWGGLIVLGSAPISASAAEVQIEGIPADEAFGLYGGSEPADNSGTIRYISIRHGGSLIGANNEINGLTLGGVGTGTTIEYVEVVANKDDGIECFGGTVNITNALVWAQGDDAYDIDQAYSGTIDNYIYIAGEESDHGLEIDGAEGAAEAGFTMRNGSLKGNASAGKGEFADFRDGAFGTVTDSYFFGFKPGADVELDADGSDDPADPEKKLSDNPETSDNFANGDLVLKDLEFNSKATDDSDITLEGIFADKWSLASFVSGDTRDEADALAQAAANKTKFATGSSNTLVTTATKGADKAAFDWTFAAEKGALNDF